MAAWTTLGACEWSGWCTCMMAACHGDITHDACMTPRNDKFKGSNANAEQRAPGEIVVIVHKCADEQRACAKWSGRLVQAGQISQKKTIGNISSNSNTRIFSQQEAEHNHMVQRIVREHCTRRRPQPQHAVQAGVESAAVHNRNRPQPCTQTARLRFGCPK